MPNWTSQDLVVIGPKRDLDRFLAKALKPAASSKDIGTFHFAKACRPPRAGGRDRIVEADLLMHWRTDVALAATFVTAWDYPRWFYAAMPKQWPTLSFACAINEEGGFFGGVVVGHEGKLLDGIWSYVDYDRKAHGRTMRPIQKLWQRVLESGRPWVVDVREPWKRRTFVGDATIDGDDVLFRFRSEEEARAFAKRYRGRVRRPPEPVGDGATASSNRTAPRRRVK